MPAGKKKKFIDKKNSVTFYLAHRSQRDPLVTDETAPQRVLVPIEQAGGAAAIYSQPGPSRVDDKLKKKEELTKYGIYFDDDYDYLQHLKDSKEVSNIEWDVCERVYASELTKSKEELPAKSELKDFKLKLPSSVFESEYQEDIGMLNKAAPSNDMRLDLDFDVRRALEDDFVEDPENVLEDDFIKLANDGDLEIMDDSIITEEDKAGLFSDEDGDDNSEDYSDMDYDDEKNGEAQDKLGNLPRRKYADFDEEETRSRFTNYSMSSSVVRRNEQLTHLDERFEKMYEGYEDTEIGALDCDDIEGFIEPDSDIILQYAKEFEQEKKAEMDLHEKITHLALKQDMEESESDDSSEESEKEKEKWDCETIISTYSTTKNRPKMIRESSNKKNVIKVSGRTGMPLGVLGVGLTKDKLRELDKEYEASRGAEGSPDEDDFQIPSKANGRSVITASGISTVRTKNETPQERHERKQMVKEYRRERRTERKANKDAFKDEKKRQVKVRLNCVSNVQGLKL